MTYERLELGITTRLFDTEAEESEDESTRVAQNWMIFFWVISRPKNVSHLWATRVVSPQPICMYMNTSW